MTESPGEPAILVSILGFMMQAFLAVIAISSIWGSQDWGKVAERELPGPWVAAMLQGVRAGKSLPPSALCSHVKAEDAALYRERLGKIRPDRYGVTIRGSGFAIDSPVEDVITVAVTGEGEHAKDWSVCLSSVTLAEDTKRLEAERHRASIDAIEARIFGSAASAAASAP